MNKNITLAKYAGFCYGVKRAVETVKTLKMNNSGKEIRVLGELIHNSHVIKELDDMGIMTVDELPSDKGGICVIRTHGASPEIQDDAIRKGYEVVDLTCPDVKKVQQKAIELAKEDYLLLILGKPEHPEVLAINANARKYSQNIFVIPDINTLKSFEHTLKDFKRVGLVIQTTQKPDLLKETVNYLLPLVRELKVFNTICPSTSMRQKEARDLAGKSDLMIVVGSKNSANTTHLAEILTSITKTILIEDENELFKYTDIIKNSENISVTAGASTPDTVIQNVINKLNEY